MVRIELFTPAVIYTPTNEPLPNPASIQNRVQAVFTATLLLSFFICRLAAGGLSSMMLSGRALSILTHPLGHLAIALLVSFCVARHVYLKIEQITTDYLKKYEEDKDNKCVTDFLVGEMPSIASMRA